MALRFAKKPRADQAKKLLSRQEVQQEAIAAIAAKAKANQQGGQGGVLLPQNSAKAIDTRAEIAEAAGVSHDTVSKVERIQESVVRKTGAHQNSQSEKEIVEANARAVARLR